MLYNTQRDHLSMPEYGRAVQDMIAVACELPTKEERTRCAYDIIAVMARVCPEQNDQDDYQTKLWNHLARISGYRLDIDYPVDICDEEEITARPAPMHYPMQHIRRRHYGHLIESCLQHATEMPPGEERDQFIQYTANQMKQSLFVWNKDAMDEQLIAQDIAVYTNGEIQLDLSTFRFGPVSPVASQFHNGKKKKK